MAVSSRQCSPLLQGCSIEVEWCVYIREGKSFPVLHVQEIHVSISTART